MKFVFTMLLIINGFLVNILICQENSNNKSDTLIFPKPNLSFANLALDAGEYKKALDQYQRFYGINPNDEELNYKLGYCYFLLNNPQKSIEHLKKSFQINPKGKDQTYFLVGRNYQFLYQFDTAIQNFNIYKTTSEGKKAKDIDKFIMECQSGKILCLDTVNLKNKPILNSLGSGINTQDPEYSMFLFQNDSTAIFSSLRENSMGNLVNTSNGRYLEDIYLAKKIKGNWETIENIGHKFNLKGNVACVGLATDSKTMFLFVGKNNGDIYYSQFIDGAWSKPIPVEGKINSSSKETSACISSDGKQMFFTSDRKNGNQGGTDLFVSTKDKNNHWGEPVNLGKNINSIYDEESPFISVNGEILYFSSKGHNSMGGFDIFMSVRQEDGNWGKPINLGYPINSPNDDIFFIYDNKTTGYFTSIRQIGQIESDIYSIQDAIIDKSLKVENNN